MRDDAKLNPTDVQYINAHGTSTPLGDLGEVLAAKQVFGDHAYKLAMSSTKSTTGHLLGAAGGVEAIFSILAMRDQVLPPTINLDEPSEGCDLDFVPHNAREAKIDVAISNSFGFGGTNGTLSHLTDRIGVSCHQSHRSGGRRDLLAPAAAFPQRYPCLLESVVRGTAQSRYDILFAFPQNTLTLASDGRLRDGQRASALEGSFLDALDAAWRAGTQLRKAPMMSLPFHGGWVLLLAYELAAEIEPTLRLRHSDRRCR